MTQSRLANLEKINAALLGALEDLTEVMCLVRGHIPSVKTRLHVDTFLNKARAAIAMAKGES